MSCGKQKTRFVSDGQVAEQEKDWEASLRKLIKRLHLLSNMWDKNTINNPGRAFELGQQVAVAALTHNPLMGALAPQLGNAVTDRGVKGKECYLTRK